MFFFWLLGETRAHSWYDDQDRIETLATPVAST